MSTSELGVIDVPKSCDVLATTLRERILSGVYRPGKQLPSERELMEQTGISRNAVREALRILEAEGLVSTRMGRYGGAFVCQPSEEILTRYLRIFTTSHSIPLSCLLEARHTLEPQVALLAALNRTPEDLVQLSEALEDLSQAIQVDDFINCNMRCHVLVASASHNLLLKVILTSLYGLIRDAAGRTGEFVNESVRHELMHFHRQIQDAIVRQDSGAAVRRMTRHVQAYEERALHARLEI